MSIFKRHLKRGKFGIACSQVIAGCAHRWEGSPNTYDARQVTCLLCWKTPEWYQKMKKYGLEPYEWLERQPKTPEHRIVTTARAALAKYGLDDNDVLYVQHVALNIQSDGWNDWATNAGQSSLRSRLRGTIIVGDGWWMERKTNSWAFVRPPVRLDALASIQAELNSLTAEEREQAREEYSRRIVNSVLSWATAAAAPPPKTPKAKRCRGKGLRRKGDQRRELEIRRYRARFARDYGRSGRSRSSKERQSR
jgi:hypothetical protein